MYGKSDRPDFQGLEGGDDHGVEILFFWDETKKMTGTVINLACPSQVVEGQRFVSADFWRPVREQLKSLLGEDLYVYAMVSAAGDQSPRDLVRRGRNEPIMRDTAGQQEMARRIVNAVRYAYERTNRSVSERFRHTRRIVCQEEVTDEEAPWRAAKSRGSQSCPRRGVPAKRVITA